MSKLEITKTVFIKASAKRVWSFLTDAKKLGEWFHKGQTDISADGPWIVMLDEHKDQRHCWGAVIEYTPYTRLIHTFTHKWLDGVETRCEWSLEEFDAGTVLTLRHTGWEAVGDRAFEQASGHDKGWDEHFGKLRALDA